MHSSVGHVSICCQKKVLMKSYHISVLSDENALESGEHGMESVDRLLSGLRGNGELKKPLV